MFVQHDKHSLRISAATGAQFVNSFKRVAACKKDTTLYEDM